jgi:1,5-anhydro-D-fructose reductase (1,5-anhydro-D-mannitol-forming)
MTLRAAVIGTGFWSRTALIPSVLAHPDATVAALIDPDPAARAAAAEIAPGAAHHGSLEAALDASGPFDLVVVATPDGLHPEQVEAALAAGAAVFCEKPLANDAATAVRLARLADAAARPATVGYSFRYNPAIQALKRDLANGRIGTPWLIELAEHNPQFHPHGGKPLNWKGDPAHARAGALYEYGSHVVDLALWLIGPVERVSTTLSRVLPGARLDDFATLQMRFAPPTTGLLVAGWVLAGGFPGIRIRVHGAEAVAEVRLDHRLPGGQSYRIGGPTDAALADIAVEPLLDPRNDASRRHMADLIALATGGTPRHAATLPDLRDGARAQEVLEASLAGSDQGARVQYAQFS